MNDKSKIRYILEKASKVLCFVLGFLLYLILLGLAAGCFYESSCLLFGAEQIVGAHNVHYHEDGFFIYTNPAAMLFRHVLYFLLLAGLTWWLAVVGEWLRQRFFHNSARFSKNIRRLMFANLLAGICVGVGIGIFAWAASRDIALWNDVRSFNSVAQYENRFGKAAYHFPQIGDKDLEWINETGRMRDRGFALGKEVYFFSSAWPFRWFLVWLEHGRIVKTTWCGM